MNKPSQFKLHPKLQQDCKIVGHFDLSLLLLMNDCHYPWFILVPQISDINEIFQLTSEQQQQLASESSYLSESLAKLFNAHKMNIAAIGNIVPQLHIHHIVRYQHDRAWPGPVWGAFEPEPYNEQQLLSLINQIKPSLNRCSFDI